eukprot:gene5012-6999_t
MTRSLLLLIVLVYISFGVSHISDQWKSEPSVSTTDQDDAMEKFIHEIMPTGKDGLSHTGNSPFDSHLKGVRSVLRNWKSAEHVCNAGLFHSIYGTEGFQGFKLPLSYRSKLRELIGPKAERLSWIFCMVDRLSVDKTLFLEQNNELQKSRKFIFTSRPELGRFQIILESEQEWLDYLELSLADWLEQVEGAAETENILFQWKKGEAWSYRREAYKKILDILENRIGERIINSAKEMYNAVYNIETEETKHLHQIETPPMTIAAREARDAIASLEYDSTCLI